MLLVITAHFTTWQQQQSIGADVLSPHAHACMQGAIWNATLRQYENLNGREYLRIFAFNTTSKTWSTNQPLKYLLEDSSHAIGDFNCVNQRFCMIIERDNAEGDP